MKQKIHELITQTAQKLEAICATPSIAQQEAWWLVEKVTNAKKTDLLIAEEIELSTTQSQTLTKWLEERINQKKPLQYILGSAPFCGLEILCEPPILIPRPETEEWCTWLITRIKESVPSSHTIPFKILDLGAGSGCVALALAKAFPAATVISTDILPEAIKLAHKNKEHTKIENVTFIISDLFEAVEGKTFDIIVSNPPYGTQEEWKTLSPEVTLWEDPDAFITDNEGLALYERIIARAKSFLKEPTYDIPQLVLEIGEDQGSALTELLKDAGFKAIEVHKDLEGKDRWVTASK